MVYRQVQVAGFLGLDEARLAAKAHLIENAPLVVEQHGGDNHLSHRRCEERSERSHLLIRKTSRETAQTQTSHETQPSVPAPIVFLVQSLVDQQVHVCRSGVRSRDLGHVQILPQRLDRPQRRLGVQRLTLATAKY